MKVLKRMVKIKNVFSVDELPYCSSGGEISKYMNMPNEPKSSHYYKTSI